MAIEMPTQLKFLLVLPFALLAIKGVAVTALVLGPTDRLLNQVKAPGVSAAVMPVQHAPALRVHPANRVPGTAKGPF
jgi:hypothetical protein